MKLQFNIAAETPEMPQEDIDALRKEVQSAVQDLVKKYADKHSPPSDSDKYGQDINVVYS